MKSEQELITEPDRFRMKGVLRVIHCNQRPGIHKKTRTAEGYGSVHLSVRSNCAAILLLPKKDALLKGSPLRGGTFGSGFNGVLDIPRCRFGGEYILQRLGGNACVILRHEKGILSEARLCVHKLIYLCLGGNSSHGSAKSWLSFANWPMAHPSVAICMKAPTRNVGSGLDGVAGITLWNSSV